MHEQVIPSLGVVLALDVPVTYGRARVGRMIGQRAQKTVLILAVRAKDASGRRLALDPHDVVASLARGLGGLCAGGRAVAATSIRERGRGDCGDGRARALGDRGH